MQYELTLDPTKCYSYADYITWLDDIRREIIDGIVSMLSAPNRLHQEISGKIFVSLFKYIQKNNCKVYSAPFDVRLPKKGVKDEKKIYNVVQPDIVIICDETKLDDKGCIGAPDLVVEILSPDSSKKDLKDKFKLYENSGVKEYWVVFPNEKSVQIFNLNKQNKYILSGIFVEGDKITSNLFPDFSVENDYIFNDR